MNWPHECKDKKEYAAFLRDFLPNANVAAILKEAKAIEDNPAAVNIFRLTVGGYLKLERHPTYTELNDLDVGTTEILASLGEMKYLERYLCENDGDEDRIWQRTRLTFTRYPDNEIVILIYFTRPHSAEVFWDELRLISKSPVIAFALIGCFILQSTYESLPKPKDRNFPVLGHFHPERFKSFRSYVKTGIASFTKDYHRSYRDADECFAVLDKTMRKERDAKLRERPQREINRGDADRLILWSELTLAAEYATFLDRGKQIFTFNDDLIRLFEKTDIDDIPVDMIHLPYSSQYFHFGAQPDLELHPGWFVDGAYLSADQDGCISITLTAMPIKHFDAALWYLNAEPYYIQQLDPALNLSITEATQTEYLKDTTQIRHDLQKEDAAFNPLELIPPRFLGEIDPKQLKNPDSEEFRKRLLRQERAFPVFQRALRLIINAACYLTAYPDDSESTWPENTPKKLLEKTKAFSPKESKKAASKLEALGYIPVKIVGQKLAKQQAAINSSSDAQRATHYRRGHWRRQAHGPRHSLRRPQWIMPQIIGELIPEEAVKGHLYQPI